MRLTVGHAMRSHSRIDDQLDIPNPSSPAGGDYLVSVPIQTALKAALYRISKSPTSMIESLEWI
ncbi:MAG: hypothetical protein F6J98_18435 [Moorea sp. SIO4G2]|uniref:hypothetical protein n=1 Tax=Moorena bouillonii TaxID=207920 RepID=UPI0011814899|nr:hypothetical protein [Moorena bouillonii]NEO62304.1 hypothetical protein [Moorena sp. SIO4G2]